jgi:hypothetical protein
MRTFATRFARSATRACAYHTTADDKLNGQVGKVIYDSQVLMRQAQPYAAQALLAEQQQRLEDLDRMAGKSPTRTQLYQQLTNQRAQIRKDFGGSTRNPGKPLSRKDIIDSPRSDKKHFSTSSARLTATNKTVAPNNTNNFRRSYSCEV